MRKPARCAVRSTACDQRAEIDLPLALDEPLHHQRQLLVPLRPHVRAHRRQVLLDRRRLIRRHREVRLHQLDRRHERDAELGVRLDRQAQVVLGPQHGQVRAPAGTPAPCRRAPAAARRRRPATGSARSFSLRVRELHAALLLGPEVDLRRRDVQHLRDVVEHLREHAWSVARSRLSLRLRPNCLCSPDFKQRHRLPHRREDRADVAVLLGVEQVLAPTSRR